MLERGAGACVAPEPWYAAHWWSRCRRSRSAASRPLRYAARLRRGAWGGWGFPSTQRCLL